MPTPLKAFDDYTEELAVFGEWDPGPGNLLASHALELVRSDPTSSAVALQALQLIRRAWATLPPEIRGQALDMLKDAAQQIADALGEAGEILGDVPWVNMVVGLVKAFVKIGKAVKGVGENKRYASNYAHGTAQFRTCEPLLASSKGMYSVVPCLEFAQYVKVRGGGDFDRKPCFSRAGLARDSIFMGIWSPEDGGDCNRKMRRGRTDSYGPFAAKCDRRLGLSGLLWPWWSAAYAPGPLPRWAGAPEGSSFDPGLSPDSNGRLITIQTRLLTDAAFNLQSSFSDVTGKCATFLNWWDAFSGMEVRPIKDTFVTTEPAKRIDIRKDPQHEPSSSAAAYWYMDETGQVVPYDGQQDAGLDDWGIALPAQQPEHLACSIGQHNAVLAMRAAFSQRRLATLRNPPLVRGLITEYGLPNLDPSAHAAIKYARDSRDLLLPYPGASSKKSRQQKRQQVPGRFPSKATSGKKPVWPLVAAGGAAAIVVGGIAYTLSRR